MVGRECEALETQARGEIERAHFRRNVQPDGAAGCDHGRKLMRTPNSRNAMVTAPTRAPALKDGIREFAARKEARRFAVDRQHVRFGQNFEEASWSAGL